LTSYGKERLVRLGLETMECKMMHDVYAKIDTFFEGFIKVNCNHCRGTWFYLKTVKEIAVGSFFKSKNETKGKVLNKS